MLLNPGIQPFGQFLCLPVHQPSLSLIDQGSPTQRCSRAGSETVWGSRECWAVSNRSAYELNGGQLLLSPLLPWASVALVAFSSHVTREARNPDFNVKSARTTKAHLWYRFDLYTIHLWPLGRGWNFTHLSSLWKKKGRGGHNLKAFEGVLVKV